MVIQVDPMHLVGFKRLTAIDFTGGNGDTSVNFLCPADSTNSPVPDFSIHHTSNVRVINRARVTMPHRSRHTAV
jgi:hypothetical protein